MQVICVVIMGLLDFVTYPEGTAPAGMGAMRESSMEEVLFWIAVVIITLLYLFGMYTICACFIQRWKLQQRLIDELEREANDTQSKSDDDDSDLRLGW